MLTASKNNKDCSSCVNCGKVMRFGDGYTSRRYHTKHGLGFYECEECYFDYKE